MGGPDLVFFLILYIYIYMYSFISYVETGRKIFLFIIILEWMPYLAAPFSFSSTPLSKLTLQPWINLSTDHPTALYIKRLKPINVFPSAYTAWKVSKYGPERLCIWTLSTQCNKLKKNILTTNLLTKIITKNH